MMHRSWLSFSSGCLLGLGSLVLVSTMDDRHSTGYGPELKLGVCILGMGRTLLQPQRMVRGLFQSIINTHELTKTGRYPYPLFEQLNTPSRALLFLLSAVIMTGSTATLKWLYGRVNGFGDGTAPRARPGAVKRS